MGTNRTTDTALSGFHPFWFWNDRLNEAEVRFQVRAMAAQGVRGFYIHPRQGLSQPYLSDAFFVMVEAAVDEAERQGLLVHLYDEYPYPSGVAGGEVILGNPQFHATRLVQRSFDVLGGPVRLTLPRGCVLHCTAYPLRDGAVRWDAGIDLRSAVGMVLGTESYSETGLTQYNRKRYFAWDPEPVLEADLPAGPHRVCVAVQAVVDGHKYWGQFVDVLNPQAVHTFIRLTHERYAARLGQHFGKTIRCIFTDETAPGWSALLPADFAARCGYDLLPLLPALQDRSHPEHLRVAADLQRVRYELFCERFEAPIAEWCRAHGLSYAAEKPVLRFSQLRFAALPGCDPGHTKAGRPLDILEPSLRKNARAVASAAYFYGGEASLCECYHSLGWSATLQDAKLIAEGLLLLGVEQLVPHAFFYSTHALKKHDAPPSFFLQMPHWALFGRLSARVERIAASLRDTTLDAGILVLDPAGGLPGREDNAVYGQLLDLLIGRHLEFHIVDTDILGKARLGADAQGAFIQAHEARARVVVVPPLRVVEPELAAWLQRAEQAGLPVLRLQPGDDAAALAARLEALAPPVLRLAASGGDASAVWAVARVGAGRRVWFLLNTGPRAVDLELAGPAALGEVPLEPGLPARLCTQGAGYARRLEPFESVLLEDAGGGAAAPPVPPARLAIRPEGPLELRADRDNLLRLGEWQLTVADGTGSDGPRAVHPAPVPNQLAEGGFRLRPAITERFGLQPAVGLPPLQLEYTAAFESAYDGPVALVVEPGSLAGPWRLLVNGVDCAGPADLAPTTAHVRGSLGLDLTPHLRPGRNVLAIRLEARRIDDGLVNPLYLAGAFGVRLGPPCLVPPVAAPAFDAWEDNGLPHFAGVVTYRWGFAASEEDSAAVGDGAVTCGELCLPRPCEDALEVSVNGGPWHAMPWSPRLLPLRPGDVRPGANRLDLRVYTTLGRAFEGQRFDPVQHTYVPVG